MFCPNCGESNEADSLFCSNCGSNIADNSFVKNEIESQNQSKNDVKNLDDIKDDFNNKKWWQWYPTVIKQYATFNGRASRSEYWYFALTYYLSFFVLSMIVFFNLIVGVSLILFFILFNFLPSIAVSIRRLHDTNRSGFWLLSPLIPLAGFVFSIILFVWYLTDSQPGVNKYGPNPKGIRETIYQ